MVKKHAKKGPELMSKETAPTQNTTPTDVAAPASEQKLNFEDLRTLQLVYKEAENAALRHRLMQMELEKVEKVVETARAELSKLNTAVNEKYKLDPAKDRINIADGTIVRG